MSKMQWDAERWRDTPPMELEGWERIPVPAGMEPWQCLPDDVADEVDRPILLEYRPSSIMGWGAAAVWIGPVEDEAVSGRS